MHNLKEIRKDIDNFKKLLKSRNLDIDNIKDLDKKNRNLIQKKEILENKKKKFPDLWTKVYLVNQKKFRKN